MLVRCCPVLLSLVACGDPDAAVDAPAGTTPAAPALERYEETIPGTDVRFVMMPVPGGEFVMGSPAGEPGRATDEGPQRRVRIAPFWIGRCEVTWDEFDQWSASLERRRRAAESADDARAAAADAIARPTPPYTDMTFGMGKERRPATGMSHLAARTYCEWLSARTGRPYRLATEAEWEFACRAGSTTAWSFGDDAAAIDRFAWHKGNSDGRYHEVGTKEPNAWGLCDMHGNVAEWVLDQYAPYAPADGVVEAPLVPPAKQYPCVVRGGSWNHGAEWHRSAARLGSGPMWNQRDPQLPQSVWYLTDASFVGFRVVRDAR